MSPLSAVDWIRIPLTFATIFLVPGWALLALTGDWRRWEGLQRWIVAVGVSIAFYPVLFYLVRPLPFLALGPYKLGALLLALAAFTLWRLRHEWRRLVLLDSLEWLAVAVFALTLFTRFWVIREYPYPAWSDSLHHALLTKLTAAEGRLPYSLEPYEPVPLAMYHLGLYALSGTVQWLVQVPSHTALLWTAQLLNGLCALGVYLALDRMVGRRGAIVGAVVVGLLSHQPAQYVNWGRFTQVASQAVLLIAWQLSWESLQEWKRVWPDYRSLVGIMWMAGLLNAAVFLLHFRVALFYLPLMVVSAGWALWTARDPRDRRRLLLSLLILGGVSLVLVAPALGASLSAYLARRAVSTAGKTGPGIYYSFPWQTIPVLVARPWLLVLGVLSLIVGWRLRRRLAWWTALWVGCLLAIGSAYLLRVPLLMVTNLGAVLIMFYLPLGLLIGTTAEALLATASVSRQGRWSRFVLGVALFCGVLGSHLWVQEVEPYRYFVTPADVEAMRWIEENTTSEARFAVNTYFWLPRSPHGTDAGYWIPYFTGRKTTAGTMLSSLGTRSYLDSIVSASTLVEALGTEEQALQQLKGAGVDYIYIGARGDFSDGGLNATTLLERERVTQVYHNEGVTILRIEE
jgi:hypothetical protein